MKIKINVDCHFEDMEVIINCREISRELEAVIASLHAMEQKLTGMKDGQIYFLEAAEVLYIEAVDKKIFLYTKNDIYETTLKLYELEEVLSAGSFFRAGKSSIINFDWIRSVKSDLDGRLIVTMGNGEKLVVSRQYASYVKDKLRRCR